VLGIAFVSACWATPKPAAPARDINISLAVEQVELANGLKLVVVPEPTANAVSTSSAPRSRSSISRKQQY
jgi:hypothetical protein